MLSTTAKSGMHGRIPIGSFLGIHIQLSVSEMKDPKYGSVKMQALYPKESLIQP